MKRSRLLLALAAGAALVLCPITLRAQGHGEAPATAHPANERNEHNEHNDGPERHGPEADRGTAEHAASAHEPAPAHEGAEHQGGHHGPPVKLFGMVLSDAWQFGIKVINFLIFAGALVFFTKGPLSAAFKARAKELEDRLSQALRDKQEGEAQMAALEAKMAGLQGELASILMKAGVDAEAEKQRILEGARSEAAAILAQTKTDIENERKSAEAQLRATVAELAIQGATQKLQAQLQGATAASAVDRAIEEINQMGGVQ